MKEALLKKRYGIPAAVLLLVLMVSGTTLAWYGLNNISSKTTVEESLSTTETTEFSANMYPGETNTWSFGITNSANVDYSVKADLTYSAPAGVTITEFKVGNSDETSDLTYDNSAEFIIPAANTLYMVARGGTIKCSMTITATGDATPGLVSVSLDLSRE